MIVLTTLTRMIENQRSQIGTLKALGYGKTVSGRTTSITRWCPRCLARWRGQFAAILYRICCFNGNAALHFAAENPPAHLRNRGMTALMVLLCVSICLYAYQKSAREEAACRAQRPARAVAG